MHWRFAFLLSILCVMGLFIIPSCGDDDDDDNNEDAGPEGGENENFIRYGWVVGAFNENGATVLHTQDAGKSWDLKTSGLPKVNFNEVSAVNKHVVWIVGDVDGEGYGTLFHTTDKGKSWQREGNEQYMAGQSLNGVDAIDESTAWAVGTHGLIMKTTNGGDSWNVQNSENIPDVTLAKVNVVDEQVVWVIGEKDDTGYATVLRTTDGGENWEHVKFEVNQAIGLIDVGGIDATTAWLVGTEGQAHRTTDGGETWSNRSIIASIYHVNGVCALDADTAYVATDQGGAYFTEDGGESWSDISPKVEDVPGIKGYELIDITTGDGEAIWISGFFFGAPDGRIIYTTNGGATWIKPEVPLSGVNFYRISFADAVK